MKMRLRMVHFFKKVIEVLANKKRAFPERNTEKFKKPILERILHVWMVRHANKHGDIISNCFRGQGSKQSYSQLVLLKYNAAITRQYNATDVRIYKSDYNFG